MKRSERSSVHLTLVLRHTPRIVKEFFTASEPNYCTIADNYLVRKQSSLSHLVLKR